MPAPSPTPEQLYAPSLQEEGRMAKMKKKGNNKMGGGGGEGGSPNFWGLDDG